MICKDDAKAIVVQRGRVLLAQIDDLEQGVISLSPDDLGDVLDALIEETRQGLLQSTSDREIIDKELRGTYAMRLLLLVRSSPLFRSPEGSPPSQFLKDWDQSSARIIQLIRARQKLSQHASDWIEQLLADVRAILDGELPGDQDDVELGTPDHAVCPGRVADSGKVRD